MKKKTRLFLAFLFIVIGAVLHFRTGIGSAWYLYAAAFILMITHFLFGNVLTAFAHLNKGQLAQAEEIIDDIKRPDFLLKGHRAYYHFVKGMIALQHKEYPEAEESLKQALDTGLRTSTDKALTGLNLAHMCFLQKRFPESRQYVEQVKTFGSTDLMIKDKVKELEAALGKI